MNRGSYAKKYILSPFAHTFKVHIFERFSEGNTVYNKPFKTVVCDVFQRRCVNDV